MSHPYGVLTTFNIPPLLPLAKTSYVSITGVKWPLHEKKLEKQQPFSISNEFELNKDAHICLQSGCVAVYIQR